MSGGYGVYGGSVLGHLADLQRNTLGTYEAFYGGLDGKLYGDPAMFQGIGRHRPSWEESFRLDMERFAADEKREARARTRRMGLLAAIPFVFLLVELALAYFAQ